MDPKECACAEEEGGKKIEKWKEPNSHTLSGVGQEKKGKGAFARNGGVFRPGSRRRRIPLGRGEIRKLKKERRFFSER